MTNDFIRYLRDGRQLSPHTIEAYRRDLGEFVAFLSHYYGGDDWNWDGVDRLALRAYLAHLSRKGLARRSIARKLSAVRSLFRFLHREELSRANPARAIRTKQEHNLRRG